MTLDEAVAAVERTLPPAARLRVDRARARENDQSFLLIVLDVQSARDAADGTGENGPRLVDRTSGRVDRLTIPEALAMGAGMRACVPTRVA
ncbi:hypothetical protein [Klenkia marina]|uniref:hypothetical protein n=1 Tax=Klenkia marina TaxID=1960309 RepID=UPI000B88DCC3|nr:hypothetical protein [Klenkia marina]